MFNVKDLNWMAGFFDGEGCICLTKRHRRNNLYPEYELKLSIGQANPLPLYVFSKSFGGNVNKRGDGYYVWQISSKKSIEALKYLIPSLVLKKKEAQAALKFSKLMTSRGNSISNKNRKEREILFNKIKDFKNLYKGGQ